MLGISNDPGVIEGEAQGAPIRNPFGGGGIIAPHNGSVCYLREVSDRARMSARIAPRVGIDPHQAKLVDGYDEARFFMQLPPTCLIDALADFNESTGKRIAATERFVGPLN